MEALNISQKGRAFAPMPPLLSFIHTVTSLPPVFSSLCSELIPGAEIFHIVDESLLQTTIREGSLTKATARRLLGYFLSAQEAGAGLAMVTCSSLGAAVEWCRPFLDIPIYRVDEPMAEKAIRLGSRIGVAATLQTTLTPTLDLIRDRATQAGEEKQITPYLCAGAFEALTAGDTARHDTLILEGIAQLIPQVDVIVLAQASMARVADQLPQTAGAPPILSSPRLAVESLAKTIA